jgi:hypothetical protein
MIVFNIVCIFIFRHKDKRLEYHSRGFTDEVRRQVALEHTEAEHRKYLTKKLKRLSNLVAFDRTLSTLYAEDPEKLQQYVQELSPVFIYLTLEYQKRNKVQTAYFPYIIKTYRLFCGQRISIVIDAMLLLVQDPVLYCRENALQALYTIGDSDSVAEAICLVDKSGFYHNKKLITDGLLSFTGDTERLGRLLWEAYPTLSTDMQVAVLDYFRFHSGDHCQKILSLLADDQTHHETRYSCLRYFGRYPYEPAYLCLLEFAQSEEETQWESTAIAATALAAYPAEQTVETLKKLLHSRTWYVRYNASQSLSRLGIAYTDLVDIFEGKDRYASEIMRYRFDAKNIKKKEETTV